MGRRSNQIYHMRIWWQAHGVQLEASEEDERGSFLSVRKQGVEEEAFMPQVDRCVSQVAQRVPSKRHLSPQLAAEHVSNCMASSERDHSQHEVPR